MTDHILRAAPLTQDNFEEFGQVIELERHNDIKDINYGQTQRFHDLAQLDLNNNNGKPLFNIFRSQPLVLPFEVKVIERHPLSSQLFFPLNNIPFLVLVAKNSDQPSVNNLQLFVTNGKQGINYAANTWHHYLLTLKQTCDFVVIDRGADDKNCEEFYFTEDILIKQI